MSQKVLVAGTGISGIAASETRVVAVFSIITAILCLVAYLGL